MTISCRASGADASMRMGRNRDGLNANARRENPAGRKPSVCISSVRHVAGRVKADGDNMVCARRGEGCARSYVPVRTDRAAFAIRYT
jgi:hypothetical protein